MLRPPLSRLPSVCLPVLQLPSSVSLKEWTRRSEISHIHLMASQYLLSTVSHYMAQMLRYLHDVFKVLLVIQLTSDEKCMWKDLSVEESIRLARANAKDIIACSFDISKTFIFTNFLCRSSFYENLIRISKCVTYNKDWDLVSKLEERFRVVLENRNCNYELEIVHRKVKRSIMSSNV